MAVDSVTNTSTATGASSSAKAQASLNNTLDDFLKLLTTQLKNQDPTNPMESSEFTQQIAQLSSVEQQINTNKNLENLLALTTASQVNNAVSYIGKRVEAEGNKGALQNGAAMFIYDLEQAAEKVTVSITDSTGKTVFSGDGTGLQGRNEVFWNGKNSVTGEQMPDGAYIIAVKAENASGNAIKTTTLTTGRVTAVNLENGVPSLSLGDIGIPITGIKTVQEDILLQASL